MRQLFEQTPEELVADWHSAAIKMRLLGAGLRLRRELPELFGGGEYIPLAVTGPLSGNVVAFARLHGTEAAIVVAPIRARRLLGRADRPFVEPGAWSDTAVTLPEDLAALRFRDAVTGDEHEPGAALPLGRALARFPVALLRGAAA
jgi:(1->4)-alpha-D-glucan 1-alpha-D-glucosylmutase